MDATHTSSNTNKRKKTEDENDSAESQNTQSNDNLKNLFTPTITNWPKYLMAKSTNENTPLTKLNPFKLAKGINDITHSRIANVTIQNNNHLLLETNNEEQSKLLLAAKQICGIPITISAHASLNFTKGVIKCKELDTCSNDEIIAGLHDQHVIECRRIKIQRNNESIYTNTYVLTFSKLQLPETIKIGYLLVRVEQYLPAPLRCTNCQKFGHHTTKCRNPKYTCWRCSKQHEPDHCIPEDPTICINCKENHPSSSKKCPAFDQEKEIIRLKYTYNLTFTEARRRVKPKTQITYASITAKKTVSRGVQTENNPTIQPSDLKSISTTSRSTTSDKPKPSTSNSSSTDQPSNSKNSSKSKPIRTAQPSVSIKPAKLKKQSQPYSKKLERQKKTNPILLNRFRALESMDAIDDISDDQYETDLDPPHSPRPPDN